MATTYATQMLSALENGKIEESNRLFTLSIQHDSNEVLYALAEELYGLGFNDKTKRIYEKILKSDPNNDQVKVDLANLAIDEDDFNEAITYLDQVSEKSDVYLQSLLVSADLYESGQLYEVSEQKLLKAYKLAPNEDIIVFALAELYYTIANYRKAVSYYLILIKKGIDKFSNVNLLSRIGISYANFGHLEQALGYLEQINEHDQTAEVLFQLGFINYQLKDFSKANHYFNELYKLDNSFSSMYSYWIKSLMQDNDLNRAYQLLQEALSIDEYNDNLYLIATEVTQRLNKLSETEKYFKKGLSIFPDNLNLLFNYSNFLKHNHKYQDVIDLLNHYVEDNQIIDPQIYWDLANAYQNLEELDKANENYQNAEVGLEDNIDFLKDEFYFYRYKGDKNKTIEIGNKYLKLNPNDEEISMILNDNMS